MAMPCAALPPSLVRTTAGLYCRGRGAQEVAKGRQQGRWRSVLAAAAAGDGDEDVAGVRDAARLVVERYLADGQYVGLGTGLAVNLLVEEVAARRLAGSLTNLRFVAASDASASEAAFYGCPMAALDAAPDGRLDVFVDVADEVDPGGAGGGEGGDIAYLVGSEPRPQQPQLGRLRALAAAARLGVVVAEHPGAVVARLGGALAVAVEEEGWERTAEELDDIFVGDAQIWRRSLEAGAGPRGGSSPYVSAEGLNILDIRFEEGLVLFGQEAGYEEIAAEVEGVEGVVAHGLFVGTARAVVVAAEGGEGPPQVLERYDEAASTLN